MKNIAILLILCLTNIHSFAQIKERKAIDNIFSEWNQANTPGCALGIIQNGELIYGRGYGLANMEYDIPNSESSVFRIGSTSKQFTAACIVLLAEQGKLDLDNSLDQFFPEFPAYAQNITVRNLLNHTSGIRDYLTISYLKGYGDDEYYQDEDIMKWLISQRELNFTPGDEFLYSNSGYWLLGQIVNKVSDMNMAEFAEKEIFKPLGMSNTHFHNDHNRIVKNRASGYVPTGKDSYQISMTTLDMIGDGGIFTSIADIKKWDDAYYNNEVLSKEFWNMMTEQRPLNNGGKNEYASGLILGEYKGYKTISHGGAFVGFRAELLRFPEERLTIAIFANRGDADPSGMARQLADIILTEKANSLEVITENQELDKKKELIKLETNELEYFVGHYWNESSSLARKIYIKNDTLRYSRSATNESDLVPISATEFKMINVGADVLVSFGTNNKGEKTMSFVANGNTPSVSIEYQPKTYNGKELEEFTGNYYSKELDVNYKLNLEDGKLLLYVNETKVSPLVSLMSDLFLNNAYGMFEFTRDTNGKLHSFKLAAGRAKNLAFKKIN
jgi:CubicO group peptidase (beta-lactamase class C family)